MGVIKQNNIIVSFEELNRLKVGKEEIFNSIFVVFFIGKEVLNI